ncbi:MAG: hypothetical protein ABIS01_13375 [Ferruginibacter sp.]
MKTNFTPSFRKNFASIVNHQYLQQHHHALIPIFNIFFNRLFDVTLASSCSYFSTSLDPQTALVPNHIITQPHYYQTTNPLYSNHFSTKL